MPELPEVETTRRGIAPHIDQQMLTHAIIRQAKLRYSLPVEQVNSLIGQALVSVERRAKYLLLKFNTSTLIIHLGMSGSLRIVSQEAEWRKHDHWQLEFGSVCLRYHDPRRFGFLIASESTEQHGLITKLGPEPLSDAFSTQYLQSKLAKRKSPIKTTLMNNELVVGIGNIYACESLFLAGIHPLTPCHQLTPAKLRLLHGHIQATLSRAIAQGGSTLRDFLNPDGQPGYFAQTLNVYGRAQQPCYQCDTPIDNLRIGGRSSYYCPQCQPLNQGKKQ
jgi:formamidopyrimidine-DNA glycosylase